MSTTGSTTPQLTLVSLETDAARNFPKWKMGVFEVYAGFCTAQYPETGLLHLVMTNDEYRDEMVRLGRDPNTVKPINTMPADLANNAGSAATAARNNLVSDFKEYVQSNNTGKTIITNSLGERNISHITGGTNQLRLFTALDIVVSMQGKHFVLNSTQLEELREILKVPLSTISQLEALVSVHRNTHAQLAEQGTFAVISPSAKLEYFVNATQHHVEMFETIKLYKTAHPLVSQQSFTGLAEYAMSQLPNMVATASRAGFSAAAQTVVAKSDESVRFAKMEQRLAALMSENEALRKQLSGAPEATLYCFKHGVTPMKSKSPHTGLTCTVMRDSTNPVYTNAQKSATCAADVVGGSTNDYRTFKRK